MAFASAAFTFVGVFLIWPVLSADSPCPDGRSCPETWSCCEYGCCAPSTLPTGKRDHNVKKNYYTDDFAWYGKWPFIYLLLTIMGICVTCVWCLCRNGGRQCACMFACCVRRGASEHDSAGSCYPPPQYSRCGSFHQAPPPYSEVTSKPDLYPLVITCAEGENKGGNYLMVHYFRNYVFRAPGSLSATSTAESLNSSFICNATNEANTIIPPPYSHADNYEEWGSRIGRGTLLRSMSSLSDPRFPLGPPHSFTAPPDPPDVLNDVSPDDDYRDNITNSPVQPRDSSYELELDLIDYDLGCDSGCRPRLGPSPPIKEPRSQEEEAVYKLDYERLRHLYSCTTDTACGSPPQPTSPTQTSRDSTLRRTSDERRHRRQEIAKKTSILRKSSLYMPLSSNYSGKVSRISPGVKGSSRSAPATPCGVLVPNLLAFTQKVSASRQSSNSSKLEEENDPLLTDNEAAKDGDHKF